MNDNKARILLTGSLLAVATASAVAQDAAPKMGEGAQSFLEEVIVTAQRREQSITDVPAQVSFFNQEYLVENDILGIEDLGDRIPSTYIGANPGYGNTAVSIRGIGGTISSGGEEPVAIYFDDQFIPRFAPSSFLDLDSIQVLRGPQVTLYGRNATAGAMLLRSARPSFEGTEGFVRAQGASYGEKRVQGAVSTPIINDELAVRFSGLMSERDGWVTNTVDGRDLDRSENWRARASLLWEPSDRTQVYVNFEAGKWDFSTARAQLAASREPGGNRIPISDEQFDQLRDGKFSINAPVGYVQDDERATFSLTQSFDNFDLVVAAGYYRSETDGEEDSDGSAADQLDNEGLYILETFTQDVRLLSTHEGPLQWIVGFSAVQDSYEMPKFDIRNKLSFGGRGFNVQFAADLPADAYALYGEATYAFNDRLSVTLGARAAYEEKQGTVNLAIDFLDTGESFIAPPTSRNEEDWTAFKPRAILQYDLSDAANLYASISTGFKSGGFNAFELGGAFDEEEIVAYEIGAKGVLFDQRVTYSAAAFYYDYTDLQLRLGVPEGGIIIQNAADAEIYGAELEFSSYLSPAIEVFGSISLLSTELKDYQTEDLSGNPVNAAGARLSRAPEVQGSLGASYETDIGNDMFARVSGVVSHRGEIFFLETDQDAPTFRGAPLTELDLRLTVGNRSQNWEVSAFVQNLTEELEVTQVELLGNMPVGTLNDPRKLGIEAVYRF